MDKDQILSEIFENDPLGLLTIKPQKSQSKNADERLLASFEEINDFIDKNKRQPVSNFTNIAEYQLFHRLKNLIQEDEKHIYLYELDRHHLLPHPTDHKSKKVGFVPKTLNSIDDILNDDSIGLLDDDDEGLFSFHHTPKQTTMPDYVARRKPCKDFEQFEHLFSTCHKEISEGIRKLIPFKNEQQINAGCFYVLYGVLLYVEKVGKKENINGKVNARLRCIFENGTESDMMLRSLSAELYKDGRRITASEDELLEGFSNVTDEDKSTGYIYILQSLSKDPRIQEIPNLYKIGFASTSVEQRIKNAENEPTYLMAKVRIIESYKCFNMNAQKLEGLIHKIFSKVCLNLELLDKEGNVHTPREWFTVPLPIIEQTISFIISGEITQMYYDDEKEVLKFR